MIAQEPWGDVNDFFDDGTGWIDGDGSAPYWTIGVEYVLGMEGDEQMSVVSTVMEGTGKAYIIEPKDEAGQPLDGTGESFGYMLMETAEDVTPIRAKVVGQGITILSMFPLKVRVELNGSDTLGLAGIYIQEVRMTIQGISKSIMRGILKVVPSAMGS